VSSSSISVLTRNGNGSYGMEERQRYNGTSQWHGRTATEWWKPGISQLMLGEFLQQFLRVIGKGRQHILTPPGSISTVVKMTSKVKWENENFYPL